MGIGPICNVQWLSDALRSGKRDCERNDFIILLISIIFLVVSTSRKSVKVVIHHTITAWSRPTHGEVKVIRQTLVHD
jgi:hypothetical protein